jgi:hypothetical protein
VTVDELVTDIDLELELITERVTEELVDEAELDWDKLELVLLKTEEMVLLDGLLELDEL